eukprot:TRINITY_DN9312_c1_g1_i4.p2 TRINITY_DN9312_c1_g1~~TRINITY_DN9312_c1_g1_i4.p2  ORF type:complete len:112 (+),score=10.33 TRINITY_DN9312_c1_g1_i4:1626-1961(+)
MMASTETYLSSLEQEAIDYAKELGRPTLSELNERFAAQHGIDSSSLYATPEKNEMHWSQEPAPSDEPMSTFMARQAFRVGFGLLYGRFKCNDYRFLVTHACPLSAVSQSLM